MAKEDIVIDLASSDEDAEPPPAKKMNVSNAMVHIPTKMRGVTIKPVTAKQTELPKLPKNITITKTTSSQLSSKIKIPESFKNKPVRKKVTTPITKGKVINPLNQIKKGALIQSVGNSTITKLKTPIQIKKPQSNKPQPLQRLPPSITITKTGAPMKPPPNISQKTLQQACKVVSNAIRKRKIVLPPVTLDDDVPSTSNNPQWYVRPEDQTKNDATDTQEKTVTEEEVTTPQEDANNKEPTGDKMIEITIEDSPIKPPKAKRARELSTEKVITIDDSPNKGAVAKVNVAEGSDEEADAVKKDPQSKKKLAYEGDLEVIEEHHTLEIEFTPIDPDDDVGEVLDTKIISLTPEIMEEEQASIEIAQNKQGAVSVVQMKAKSKQPKGTTKEEILKKKPAIKSEFHPIYQAFITLCVKLENSDDMEKIIEKKIKPYYRQVPKEYVESDEFLDMVYSKITAIEAAPAKLYLYIKDIVDELNLQRKIVRPAPVENKPKGKEKQSYLHGREHELTPRKQRQIKRLEVTLKKLNRAIQKLENQEVNFDDEEDSVYLLTEKYKERMVRVHAKFCQLTNTKLPTEPRLIIEARPGLSTAPAKKLEDFINHKNKVVFPDFHDVLRCVREANDENKLNWSEACIMEEARDLFVRCGRKIQRRRQENEWRLATSRITPNSDPAEQSEDLKTQLDANRRVASTKESEVFEEFCDKQSQMKLEAEEIDDKDAEGSPSESEEEDNEEPCSLENKQRRKERIKRLLQEISKKNNKTTDNDNPLETEPKISEEIEIESDADQESKIQTLSDDNNEMGSDMDELNLLQKLHSGSERRTSDSSDSESPLSISDTLESSSDYDGKNTKLPSPEIVSIENSSYSDDSDSEKNNKRKTNKQSTKDIKQIEIKSSSSRDAKNTNTSAIITESMAISSSDDESTDNTNAVKSDELDKKDQVMSDKDFECSILSETAELCEDINECAKPSDAEDERSLNSDTIENRGSSASSGQFEELLKEYNADPFLKQPDLIPRDPSDKLFDSLVMKHYNDPLVKAHLKGSDSSNGENAENSNSDTQSLDRSMTAEEAKTDLIETSVDTDELLRVSPSMQIVDKFIEKIKNSDGSLSSDEFLKKVDDELDLDPEAGSPVCLALEKAVTAARKTKSWPRFRDECSSTSSEVDSDNSPILTKTNEAAIETDVWSLDSTKDPCGEVDDKQNENNASEPKASSSKSTEALSEEKETTDSHPVSDKNRINTDSSSSSVESDKTATSESANAVAQDDVNQADADALSSESTHDVTVATDSKSETDTISPSKNPSPETEVVVSEISSTENDIRHDNSNEKEIAPSEVRQTAVETTGTEGTELNASSLESTKNIYEEIVPQPEQVSNEDSQNDPFLDIAEYCRTRENSPSMTTPTNESDVPQITDGSSNTEKEPKFHSKVSHSESLIDKDKNNDDSSIKMHVDNSECKNISKEFDDTDFEMTSAETNAETSNTQTTEDIPMEMDIYDSVTPFTEEKLDNTDSVDHSVINTEDTQENDLNVHEIKTELTKPVPEENPEIDSASVEAISNGNLNINMEISDLLPTDSNLSQKNGEGDRARDLSEMSVEKDCCDEGTDPRTITSVEGTE